jgi:hypothetical protein
MLCPPLGEQAKGSIYWGADPGISRVNLDGSLLESPLIRPNAYSVCALAVNSTHIYWADSYGNKIGRAKLDGTAVESELISPAGDIPCDLTVDSNYIYWANRSSAIISRARLDGSSVEADFLLTQPVPCGVAVGLNSIYWTTESDDKVWATDIAGLNPPRVIIDGSSNPCDVALTSTNIYWADRDYGIVSRANLDGSAALRLFSVPGYVSNIAVNESYLYWVHSQPGFESIGRASLDGTQVDPAFLTGQHHPYALAADSLRVVPPVTTPPEQSKITVGKLRRNRKTGSVSFPVDIYEEGWLRIVAGGVRVTVLPEGIKGSASLQAGRKLIKISPTTKRGDGSRCVLRVFRNGGKVRRTLLLAFHHSGKVPVEETRSFLLFKPRTQDSRLGPRRKRAVTCMARSPKS